MYAATCMIIFLPEEIPERTELWCRALPLCQSAHQLAACKAMRTQHISRQVPACPDNHITSVKAASRYSTQTVEGYRICGQSIGSQVPRCHSLGQQGRLIEEIKLCRQSSEPDNKQPQAEWFCFKICTEHSVRHPDVHQQVMPLSAPRARNRLRVCHATCSVNAWVHHRFVQHQLLPIEKPLVKR